MGWEVVPRRAPRAAPARVRADYDLPPVYVTENGAAYDDCDSAGAVDDPRAGRVPRRHLGARRATRSTGRPVARLLRVVAARQLRVGARLLPPLRARSRSTTRRSSGSRRRATPGTGRSSRRRARSACVDVQRAGGVGADRQVQPPEPLLPPPLRPAARNKTMRQDARRISPPNVPLPPDAAARPPRPRDPARAPRVPRSSKNHRSAISDNHALVALGGDRERRLDAFLTELLRAGARPGVRGGLPRTSPPGALCAREATVRHNHGAKHGDRAGVARRARRGGPGAGSCLRRSRRVAPRPRACCRRSRPCARAPRDWLQNHASPVSRRAPERLVVHPGEHEHAVGLRVLDDGGAQLRRHRGRTPAARSSLRSDARRSGVFVEDRCEQRRLGDLERLGHVLGAPGAAGRDDRDGDGSATRQ